eukprot:403367595
MISTQIGSGINPALKVMVSVIGTLYKVFDKSQTFRYPIFGEFPQVSKQLQPGIVEERYPIDLMSAASQADPTKQQLSQYPEKTTCRIRIFEEAYFVGELYKGNQVNPDPKSDSCRVTNLLNFAKGYKFVRNITRQPFVKVIPEHEYNSVLVIFKLQQRSVRDAVPSWNVKNPTPVYCYIHGIDKHPYMQFQSGVI